MKDFIAIPRAAQEGSTRPSVTVIVPVHNGEAFLEGSIRSAAALDQHNSDVIVVNDGRTDSTSSILERLSQELPNARHVAIPSGGVANARNHATGLAHGDCAAFLDAELLIDTVRRTAACCGRWSSRSGACPAWRPGR